MDIHKKIWPENPGCMTRTQILYLQNVLERAHEDPALLSDLEGCGPVARLEKEFARICGTRFALAVSSGTAAIHAALLASGIGYGDEVIVTPYSWPQSVSPVIFTGATPIFADINPYTLNLDPDSVMKKIGPKTRAILPVHLFGHPADMLRLEKIASEAGIILISDAAHALGAKLYTRPVSAWGDVSCFSLGRGKLVSGGEGGIITTDDEALYERAVSLTQHPERLRRIKRPSAKINQKFGLNYRMHSIAALLALSDIGTMEKKLWQRKAVLESFMIGLGEQNCLARQLSINGEQPAAYGTPLIFRKEKGRENVVLHLQKKGIPLRCGPVSIPLHLRLDIGASGSCPIAEEHCKKKEIWVLSALDMDGVSHEKAYAMGDLIREELKEFSIETQND